MRLSEETLDRVSRSAELFSYRREEQALGIVHLGVGAFHRAHQAWYTDLAMDAGDHGWGILGVSLRSGEVANRLNPQDGLYSLTTCDGDSYVTRILGALRRVVAADTPAGKAASVDAIAASTTKIVSLTITEKGYARRSAGDQAESVEQPVYPLLASALRKRREAGLPGLTLCSCDNLSDNGLQLENRLISYLSKFDILTAGWVADHCTFPSSMVDRIVPASTSADLKAAAIGLGVEDHAAIVSEPFSQWVIEDRFAAGRPAWERVGVQFVNDVRPYEIAKLRMLNGAHSALAYLGLERGHTFVDEAIRDPQIAPIVNSLVRHEAAESFAPAAGQDLSAYADSIFKRLSNRALHHRLDQIASDGSQKIEQRWLATIADRRKNGVSSPALIEALSGWVNFARTSAPVNDPMADRLAALWAAEGVAGIAGALFSARGHFAGALTSEETRELTNNLRLADGRAANNRYNHKISEGTASGGARRGE